MQIYQSLTPVRAPQGSAVALGYFDGVHCGHRAVLGAAVDCAKANGLDYAIDVYPHYGSDVEATLTAGYDIRHGLIGPGVYASHNYERSHMDGVRNTFELLRAYVAQ